MHQACGDALDEAQEGQESADAALAALQVTPRLSLFVFLSVFVFLSSFSCFSPHFYLLSFLLSPVSLFLLFIPLLLHVLCELTRGPRKHEH